MLEKSRKRMFFAGAFAALTVASMALFFHVYDPWQSIRPNLIHDSGFNDPGCTNEWTGWGENTLYLADGGFNGTPGIVLTACGALRMTVRDLQNIPAFRVSARATASRVVPGKKGWDLPKGVFFYRNTDGKSLFGLHHGIFDLQKDTPWKQYSAVFPVPKNVLDGRLQFRNDGSGGILQIDDVSIVPVQPRTSAAGYSIFFLLLWSSAFACCFAVLKPWKRRGGKLIVLTVFAIVIGTAAPGLILDTSIKETAHFIKNTLAGWKKQEQPLAVGHPGIPATSTSTSVQIIQKKSADVKGDEEIVNTVHLQGHLILFILLAVLCTRAWPRWIPVAAGLLLFACSTEVLQYVSIGRAAGIDDLLIDLAGCTVGIFCTCIIQKFLLRPE